MFKTVYLPITVPEGEYCWYMDGTIPGAIKLLEVCPLFTNEGGKPHCVIEYIMGFEPLQYDKEGQVHKPKKCLELSDKFITLMKGAANGKKM